jgi:hypothetical protein
MNNTYKFSYGGVWLIREEALPSGDWLMCWIRPDGYQRHTNDPGNMPYGWVRVYPTPRTTGEPLEEYCLCHPHGALEVECIAYEMREKYKWSKGLTPTGSATVASRDGC